MGTYNNQEACETCGEFFKDCRGHYGCIPTQYAFPVPQIQECFEKLLKLFCIEHLTFFCDCPVSKKKNVAVYNRIYIEKFDKMSKIIKSFRCLESEAYRLRAFIQDQDKHFKIPSSRQDKYVILNPNIIYDLFEKIYKHKDMFFPDGQIPKGIPKFDPSIVKSFMFKVVPVPANVMRIPSQQTQQNHFNTFYGKVITSNIQLKNYSFPLGNGLFTRSFSETELYWWTYFFVSCRLCMSKDTSKNTLASTERAEMFKAVNSQNIQEPCSMCSASLTKDGTLRQVINSIRVNCSSRSVITPLPQLFSKQAGCPIEIAQIISRQLVINNVNIQHCRNLVSNWPSYPCAVKVYTKILNERTGDTQWITKIISQTNKDTILKELQPGQMLYRQIIEHDIGMTNRFPSIQEESFGAHNMVIRNTKSIQYNLQILPKMGADFDGDECQLYFLPCVANSIEVALLLGMQRQLIAYTTGTNLIGGCPDLDCGIYYIHAYPEYLQGVTDIINQFFPKLSYTDGSIEIVDGNIVKFDSKICSTGSKFITYIAQHYYESVALTFLDTMIQYIYKVNYEIGSSITPNILQRMPDEVYNLTEDRVKRCNDLIDKYHTGQILTSQELERQLIYALSTGEMQQKTIILKMLYTDGIQFQNKILEKNENILRAACASVGQIYDEAGHRLNFKYQAQGRTFPMFNRFDTSIESGGFIKGCYTGGLTQLELFMDCVTGRYQLFKKGGLVAINGYTSRKTVKGTDSLVQQHNGFVSGDGDTVVALQYGTGGFDCRKYATVPFTFHTMPEEELFKLYGKHPLYSDILAICKDLQEYDQQMYKVDQYYSGFSQLVVPYYFKDKTVSLKQLNDLWTSRITSKMSQHIVKVIQNQVIQFYIYALFYLTIDENSTHNLCQDYLQSLSQSGETIGLKAAMACTQPYTDDSLKAIHKVIKVKQIQLSESTGADRFMELVTNKKYMTVFTTRLLNIKNESPEDEEARYAQFISDVQSIPLSYLQPQFEVEFVGDAYQINMFIKINMLALYDINLKNFVTQLQNTFAVNLKRDDTEIQFQLVNMYNQLSEQHALNFIRQQYIIGNGFMHNVHLIKRNGKLYITGNLPVFNKTKCYFKELLRIPGIDQDYTFCNSPYEYEKMFGIKRAEDVMYIELNHNLSALDATRYVQRNHNMLITCSSTSTGKLSKFTRGDYNDMEHRPTIDLMTYEEGDVPCTKTMLNPKKQSIQSLQSSQIYGAATQLGTTNSLVYNDPQSVFMQTDVRQMVRQYVPQMGTQLIEGM